VAFAYLIGWINAWFRPGNYIGCPGIAMAAIGGSATSMKALMEAKHMAFSRHAMLRIVYAVSNSDDAHQQAGLKLLAQTKSVISEGADAETRVLHADAVYGLIGIAEAIANAANEWGTDLAVVGTKNRRGLERLVIGSVTEQLIAEVDASVLLVRPH
jgi:nucleotide-binding universal stress UspA family protein